MLITNELEINISFISVKHASLRVEINHAQAQKVI